MGLISLRVISIRLRYFHALNKLTNASKLCNVSCNNVLAVLSHLLFHEPKKTGNDRVGLITVGLPFRHLFGRHKNGTVRHHRDLDLASKLGMRVKTPSWQAHASRVTDLRDGAFVLLFIFDSGHGAPRSCVYTDVTTLGYMHHTLSALSPCAG
jgi:hypothetical protein